MLILAFPRQQRKENEEMSEKEIDLVELKELLDEKREENPSGMSFAEFLKLFCSLDEEKKQLLELIVKINAEKDSRALSVLTEWNNGTEHNAEDLRQRLEEINII